MTQKFTDNGRALLMGNILAVDTSLSVEASKADRFPVADTVSWGTPLDWFKAVLIDSAGNREVIKVGTRTLGSGVFGNILRAQDGTTALAFNAGSIVIHAITAADIEAILSQTFTGEVSQDGVVGRITPVGGIIMWSGTIATIPTGWSLCDGTNGTPDLRDKFIVGAAVDSSGAKTNITGAATQSGGSKDGIVPTHSHTATSTFAGTPLGTHGHPVVDPGHDHRAGGSEGGGGTGAISQSGGSEIRTGVNTTGISVTPVSAGTPAGTVSTTVASTGVSVTNANLPPYYALAFIQCLAP